MMISVGVYFSALLFFTQIALFIFYKPTMSNEMWARFFLSFSLLLVLAYFKFYSKRTWNSKQTPAALASVALRQFTLAFGLSILLNLVIYLSCAIAADYSITIENLSLSLIFYALVWSSMAAFFEEIVCRGFLLGAFLRVFPKTINIPLAVTLQAVIFTYFHAHQLQISAYLISVFCCGILLGIFAVQTRALWMSFGFHCAWNVCSKIVLGLHNKRTPNFPGVATFDANHTVYGTYCLCLVTLGAIGFVLIRKKDADQKSIFAFFRKKQIAA
jgi:membrane protease YdiL (CAAX protease family)